MLLFFSEAVVLTIALGMACEVLREEEKREQRSLVRGFLCFDFCGDLLPEFKAFLQIFLVRNVFYLESGFVGL